MRFFIDGTEWSAPAEDLLTREEQLDALREYVAAQDRVIVDMLSDGESLDEKDILNVPDAIDVEVSTATAWGVGLEILEEIKNSLLAVFKALQTALDGSQRFDKSQLDDAREQLDWVRAAVESFADAYPDYEKALPDPEPLLDGLETFSALLTDGRYAAAQQWHENDWKKEILPPFLDRIKELKDWFDANDDDSSGSSDDGSAGSPKERSV